ncbi:BsuPI-related putative proteinase inhibitor [Salipaludibacillus daqingensis]|uniref:BsuPI-related putative proteinase inhibitor n=1 Tax=Salipaludibacillus daqingensis TaxID=3041001 RepID=UPI002476B2F1|nr:BsuPI-related putative proteinase inhibitor [Salipaludibacillus daqingensis]
MIKMKVVLILASIMFIISACGQENVTEIGNNVNNSNTNQQELDQEENEQEQGEKEGEPVVMEYEGIKFAMNVEQTNASLRIQLTLENVSDEMKQIDFASGHQYDILIYDEDNKLYDFAEGKMFTQAIISEELAPGDKLEFEDEPDLPEESLSKSLKIATKLNVYEINGQSVSGDPFTLTTSWTQN